MAEDPACPTCGHPVTMNRCWRLTCPTNGAKESFASTQAYEAAKRDAARRGEEIRNPTRWGEPPQQEFML